MDYFSYFTISSARRNSPRQAPHQHGECESKAQQQPAIVDAMTSARYSKLSKTDPRAPFGTAKLLSLALVFLSFSFLFANSQPNNAILFIVGLPLQPKGSRTISVNTRGSIS
jgi:hypothetical protein